jgi:hypothetical protein
MYHNLIKTRATSGDEEAQLSVGSHWRRRLVAVVLTLALAGGFGLASVAAAPVAAPAHAGNYEWWGYRTNSWETWALATQSADYNRAYNPLLRYFSVATYIMATSWRWNAQSARMMGQCTGITWSGSPVFVGCSWR